MTVLRTAKEYIEEKLLEWDNPTLLRVWVWLFGDDRVRVVQTQRVAPGRVPRQRRR